MKKQILAISVICFMLIGVCSNVTAQSDTTKYKYCEVVGTQGFLSRKVSIVIDYGEETSFWADRRLKDQSGNVIKFNSMIDVVNYMSSKGWDWDKAFPVSTNNSLVYHFYFKKK